jgi:hypothetical protein
MKNIIRRNFFIDGDIVVDKAGCPFLYVKAKGFNESVVIPLDKDTLEFTDKTEESVLVNAKLYFHPKFNPGNTHISNR